MTTLLLERHDWHMRSLPGRLYAQEHPVDRWYIHQTAGRDPVEKYPSGDDDPIDAFTALNEYAITGKGYGAVDYSFLTHTGPSMRTTNAVARGEYKPAATLDDNTDSKASCLLGWFGPPDPRYPWTFEHAREPFDQELWALAETIVTGIRRGWALPSVQILGHRDNHKHPNATACPGDYLYAKLPVIRAYVAHLLNGPPPAVRNNPPLVPALDALAVAMTWCACNPGGGSQDALWDVVFPHMTGIHIMKGDPRREAFVHAAQYPGNGKLRGAWLDLFR